MNLAWEAALCADRSGIDRERIRYRPTKKGSPYMELKLESLNDTALTGPSVEINPLFRFSALFAEMFDINLGEYQASREVFFDVYMQYIVQLDLRQGLSRKEYQLRHILRDFMGDVCGIKSDVAITQMERGKLRVFLRLTWKLYRCGASGCLFREAMRAMYPSSLVYESKEKENQLLVYIGEEESGKERVRMECLQALFLPINKEVRLFWDRHFGIMGIDETMVLDEMVLF